jgi:hypothetical protein
MLLWEEGLIRVEVSRKKRQHCHTAPITQFELQSGDLTTVGMDQLISTILLLARSVLSWLTFSVVYLTSLLPVYYGGRQSQQSFLFSSISLTSLHVSARAGHLQVNTIVS